MIKRLHKRRTHGTLVANGRRKRRNGKGQAKTIAALRAKAKKASLRSTFSLARTKMALRKAKARAKACSPRRKKRGLSAMALVQNGSRHKRHNGHRGLSHLKAYRKKRHNGSPSMGGVGIVDIGIGAVVTIAAGSIGKAIVHKYGSMLPTGPIKDAAPSLVVAGAAYLMGKKVFKGAKSKSICNVVVALSIFKAIDDSLGQKIEDTVSGVLPTGFGTGGAYIPALRGNSQGQLSGAYMDAQGGTHGALPQHASLYGI